MTSTSASAQTDSSMLPPSVVLVEDDHELREGLAENLRLSGMQVTEAESGMAFHAILARKSFDVAVLDVNLPDTTGFALSQGLVSGGYQLGIILLTARAGRNDRIEGYDVGADIYLTKPVDGEELALAIRNLTRRVRGKRDSVRDRTPSVWRLNILSSQLTAPDGQVLSLTGREVLLFEQIAGAKGAPVSRGNLAMTLGYETQGPESRGLDVALGRLRRKFTDAGLKSPLVGVRNVGMRFFGQLEISE